jgi:O-antigen ligase
MDKYLKYIPLSFFIGGLLIIPFFYLPSSPVPYEVPKVWLFNRWVEAIVLSGLIFLFSEIKREKIDKTPVILLFLFLLTATLTSFAGVDTVKSFLGNYYRGDGLLTLFHSVSVFLFIVLFFKKKWIGLTISAFGVSAVGVSLWVLFDTFRLYVLKDTSTYNWDGALAVSFGNPNFLSGFLLVSLPFTTYIAKVKQKKYFYLGIVLQISAILLTFARAGILGIPLFFFLLYIISKKIKPLIIILFTLFFVLFSILFIRGDTAYKSEILVSESRQRIYTKAYLAFLEKPITGWGWANFDHAFDSVNWPIQIGDDVYVDKAHSMAFEILVTTGLFGLTFYLLFAGNVAKNLYGGKSDLSKYLMVSLVLYLLHSQINVISISEEMIFWIVAGISVKRSLFR